MLGSILQASGLGASLCLWSAATYVSATAGCVIVPRKDMLMTIAETCAINSSETEIRFASLLPVTSGIASTPITPSVSGSSVRPRGFENHSSDARLRRSPSVVPKLIRLMVHVEKPDDVAIL